MPDLAAAELRALVLIDAFLSGQGEVLCAAGDEAFAAAARADDFARVRAGLGEVRARGPLRLAPRDDLVLVAAPVEFAGGGTELRLALRGPALAGFFVVPDEPPVAPWTAPDYVDPAAFVEIETRFSDLPATLTSPRGCKRPPVCLFLHGSGPADRDGTVGPNKPFRDLAQGLATRGVASLRYEKRTRARPGDFAGLAAPTVKDEVLDDAAAALRFLSARDDVSDVRVLVGHSLGAMLAPRVAAETPGTAGIVMISAAARPLPEVTLAQFEYLNSLSPFPAGRLDDLRGEVARVGAARPGEEGAPFLGVPLSWWADLNAYDAAAAARAATAPLLALHGGRDYQATDDDFRLLQTSLADRPFAQLRRFADLNHLMMTGQGRSRPEEYQRPGHVDVAVVSAIAEFVAAISP